MLNNKQIDNNKIVVRIITLIRKYFDENSN